MYRTRVVCVALPYLPFHESEQRQERNCPFHPSSGPPLRGSRYSRSANPPVPACVRACVCLDMWGEMTSRGPCTQLQQFQQHIEDMRYDKCAHATVSECGWCGYTTRSYEKYRKWASDTCASSIQCCVSLLDTDANMSSRLIICMDGIAAAGTSSGASPAWNTREPWTCCCACRRMPVVTAMIN